MKKQNLKLNKMQAGEILSCYQYMKVTGFKKNGEEVVLTNDQGKTMEIQKQILVKDSYSADHFETQKVCNMTELVEILKSAGDNIFTIQFKTQVDPSKVAEKLQELKLKQIKDNADEIKKLTKTLVEGATVTLIGHLAEGSQKLGRTLVVDLEVNGFKQVDHRSIQWIVLKNIKYALGRKSPSSAPAPIPGAEDEKAMKWDPKKLAIGNWFSEIQYYKYKHLASKKVYEFTHIAKNEEDYQISDDQVIQMFSSAQYNSEEAITRTQMVDILTNAKNSVFTITFRKKLLNEEVEKKLLDLKTASEMKSKEFAASLITGEKATLVCILTKSEPLLGRSLVIDLTRPYGKGFRQVDHRTVDELIIKNVKYTIKK